MPLQLLADTGFFKKPTSCRLVIIDGLDKCSEPKVQQNILEVLANSQQQYQLPLIFLFASCPEQHISHAFNTGLLSNVTSRLTLDESYLPDEDIKLFLADKFHEIKSTHQLCAYIPSQWPLPNILQQLVQKSSGQFIYASTVIHYVTSIRHKPVDRLDIIWSKSNLPDSSSWLWQDPLQYPGKISFFPGIHSTSGKHPSVYEHKSTRFLVFFWNGSIFESGPSARRGVSPWWHRIHWDPLIWYMHNWHLQPFAKRLAVANLGDLKTNKANRP